MSAFATALILLGALVAQSPPPAAAVECTGQGARLLAKVPEFIVKPINPSDAGPG